MAYEKLPPIMSASKLKVLFTGLRAFERIGNFVKPSTRMIHIFGYLPTRARLDIGEQQLRTLLSGDLMRVDPEVENGYVILSLKGHTLGLGLFINGSVRSQIPPIELVFFEH